METFLAVVVSLVVGSIATILVTRYYFYRSTARELTPYLQYSTSVFGSVDSTLREDLVIQYKNVPVDNLHEVQLLIANTGERAITHITHPLTLELPSGSTVLEVSLLHIEPEGRTVTLAPSDEEIVFHFSLLNSSEFFIVKLLFKDNIREKDLTFRITAEDLPPLLSLRPFPIDLYGTRTFRTAGIYVSELATGVVMAVFGVSVLSLIYLQWPLVRELWDGALWETVRTHWFPLLTSTIGAVLAILLLVGGTFFTIDSFVNFAKRKGARLAVPPAHARFSFPSIKYESGDAP